MIKREVPIEIVFLLDRSGSMHKLVEDTIGGYNSFINKQKEAQKADKVERLLTTVLFDHNYEILHDRMDINKVELLTSKDYFSRGTTALLDAIGLAINNIKNRHMEIDKKDTPKVIFVITTDGEENSSDEFGLETVKSMIEKQTNKYDWQFIFLGANIDAISVAETLGIDSNSVRNYTASSQGTRVLYDTLSKGITKMTKNDGLNFDLTTLNSIE